MATPDDEAQGFDFDVFDKVLKVNLYGSIYTAKYCVEAMKRNEPNENNQRGCFIFTSSICSDSGFAGQIPYAASKSAMNGLMLPMARDLGFLGIRANCISPGVIKTGIHEASRKELGLSEEDFDKLLDGMKGQHPLQTFGQTEDFAHWV